MRLIQVAVARCKLPRGCLLQLPVAVAVAVTVTIAYSTRNVNNFQRNIYSFSFTFLTTASILASLIDARCNEFSVRQLINWVSSCLVVFAPMPHSRAASAANKRAEAESILKRGGGKQTAAGELLSQALGQYTANTRTLTRTHTRTHREAPLCILGALTFGTYCAVCRWTIFGSVSSLLSHPVVFLTAICEATL